MPIDPTTLERFLHCRCRRCGKRYEYWPDLDPRSAAIYCSPECSMPPEANEKKEGE